MKPLLDGDLVKVLGKKEEPGRPLLYGTTAAFLEFFGLKSLKDLPSLREFTELSDDSRRVSARGMGGGAETPADPGTPAAAAAEGAAGGGARRGGTHTARPPRRAARGAPGRPSPHEN